MCNRTMKFISKFAAVCLVSLSALVYFSSNIYTSYHEAVALKSVAETVRKTLPVLEHVAFQNHTKGINETRRTRVDHIGQVNKLKESVSQTVRKTYPVLGTGKRVNISNKFDSHVFNSFCQTEESLKAVLPIYSTLNRFELRDILRKTLGKWARTLHCKVFFILGPSLNSTDMEHVGEEYVREKDILMIENIDSYRDLNDKAVAMVRWISEHCTNVPYVIHLIDDTYVNIPLFLNRMDRIHRTNYILGGYFPPVPVPRDSKLKTFLTEKEYPRKMLPVYAIGFAYAFPTSVAGSLLSAVYKADYCWIEDVWFTGHVREAAGVETIDLKRGKEWVVVNEVNSDMPVSHVSHVLPWYYIVHSVEPELFHKMYPKVGTLRTQTTAFILSFYLILIFIIFYLYTVVHKNL